MRDERILELLSRSLDETLEPADRRTLDEALAESAELREIARDLETLRVVTEEPLPECSPRTFEALEARVARRYPPRRFRLVRGGWLTGGLALAALLVLALLGPLSPEPEVPGPAQDPAFADARAEVQAAQSRFHDAIRRMERLAHDRLARMPPALAHGFAENLAVINTAIRDCERMAEEAPGNGPNYLALSRAYEAKVELLEMIIEG